MAFIRTNSGKTAHRQNRLLTNARGRSNAVVRIPTGGRSTPRQSQPSGQPPGPMRTGSVPVAQRLRQRPTIPMTEKASSVGHPNPTHPRIPMRAVNVMPPGARPSAPPARSVSRSVGTRTTPTYSKTRATR